MGNRVIECETCQTVCPWNKKHVENPLGTKRTLLFGETVDRLRTLFTLSNLMELSESDYAELITPYRVDIPYRIFRRNVVAALGNSNRPEAVSLLRSALEDSDQEVRDIARFFIKAFRA
jgi:epoxyqueuosine reductase QueG